MEMKYIFFNVTVSRSFEFYSPEVVSGADDE